MTGPEYRPMAGCFGLSGLFGLFGPPAFACSFALDWTSCCRLVEKLALVTLPVSRQAEADRAVTEETPESATETVAAEKAGESETLRCDFFDPVAREVFDRAAGFFDRDFSACCVVEDVALICAAWGGVRQGISRQVLDVLAGGQCQPDIAVVVREVAAAGRDVPDRGGIALGDSTDGRAAAAADAEVRRVDILHRFVESDAPGQRVRIGGFICRRFAADRADPGRRGIVADRRLRGPRCCRCRIRPERLLLRCRS